MAVGNGMDFDKCMSLNCLSLPSSLRFHTGVRILTKRYRLVVVGTTFLLVALLVQLRPHEDTLSRRPENVQMQPVWPSLASNACFQHLSNWSWRQLSLPHTAHSVGVENKTTDVRIKRNETSRGINTQAVEVMRWTWDTDQKCGLQTRERDEMLKLLKGSWLAVIGDSQARFMLVAFLQLLLPDIKGLYEGLFKRHSNYELTIPEADIRFLFVWAPYEQDIAASLQGFHWNGTCPDIVIMGAGLWHMLHVADVLDFRMRLAELKATALSFLSSPACSSLSKRSQESEALEADDIDEEEDDEDLEEDLDEDASRSELSNDTGPHDSLAATATHYLAKGKAAELDLNSSSETHPVTLNKQDQEAENSSSEDEDYVTVRNNRSILEVSASRGQRRALLFFMNLPSLVNWKLNTAEKQRVMSNERLHEYESEIQQQGLLFPAGPAFLLDLMRVSRECGHECTEDGMHYDLGVYEALVQIMGGVLSILYGLTQS